MKALNQKRLCYFYEVYKHGSITRAADALAVDPSVVTRQIKILEKEIGTGLFERGKRGRGMLPTEAARLVLKYNQVCRTAQDTLEEELQKMYQVRRGEIRIVTSEVYMGPLIEEILKDFCNEHPNLNIQLDEQENASQIVEKILDDSAHIGILHSPINEENLYTQHSAPLPIYLLVNPTHPISNKEKVTLSEISHYPIVFPHNQSHIGHLVQSAVQKENIRLNSVLISGSTTARKKFIIGTHLAGTFMSAFAAQREIKLGQLIPVEVDHPDFIVQTCLIVRRRRPLSTAVNQCIQLIENKFSFFYQGKSCEKNSFSA